MAACYGGGDVPELPEVETTLRGIEPLLHGRDVTGATVYEPRLRQPVNRGLPGILTGARLNGITRRAKYLLFDFGHGWLIAHLGMSGSLRVVAPDVPRALHEHVEIRFGESRCLRLRDPRRFGLILWTEDDPMRHELLRNLGPEPFDPSFTGAYLRERARGRSLAIKNFIMDGHTVVGVGNIYASEALFRAGIHPARAAGRVGLERYERLTSHIRSVLGQAIEAGGTTLRDFVAEDGRPGYFSRDLQVYGRDGEPCVRCGQPLRVRVIGQRSSFFCTRCQH